MSDNLEDPLEGYQNKDKQEISIEDMKILEHPESNKIVVKDGEDSTENAETETVDGEDVETVDGEDAETQMGKMWKQ